MCEKKEQPDFRHGLSDKISTTPSGWDLSELLAPTSSTENERDEPGDQDQVPPQTDPEAKMRADWQLDPHFDRRDDPSRPDLSAY